MPYLNPRVLDAGLSALDTEATHLHITNAEISSFAAVAGASLGNSAANVGAPADRSPSGRRVTVASISGASVGASGTASHWCLVDQTNSRVLAAAPLSASQAVVSGNSWALTAFDIGIPGPV